MRCVVLVSKSCLGNPSLRLGLTVLALREPFTGAMAVVVEVYTPDYAGTCFPHKQVAVVVRST